MNPSTILTADTPFHGASMTKVLTRDPDVRKQSATERQALDEERRLIQKAQAGDPEAFRTLVYRHDRAILGLAFGMMGNREDAQDVYQETFLKAYRSINRFQFKSRFYTWIYRIATNVCLDHLRKQQKKRAELSMDTTPLSHADGPVLEDTLADTTHYSNPERALYGKEVGQKIRQALKSLTEKERLVFQLRHYRNLRLKVIGNIIGTTESTVKNYLFHGTQKLRARLSEL